MWSKNNSLNLYSIATKLFTMFKLSEAQENELLNQPETGMGYQVVEASKAGSYTREKFIVLNSEFVFEMMASQTNTDTSGKVFLSQLSYSDRQKLNENAQNKASIITLNNMSVLNGRQFRNIVNESKNENEGGAIENPVETNGEEIFVRLSAFDNDRRVDKKKGVCVLAVTQPLWKIISNAKTPMTTLLNDTLCQATIKSNLLSTFSR